MEQSCQCTAVSLELQNFQSWSRHNHFLSFNRSQPQIAYFILFK